MKRKYFHANTFVCERSSILYRSSHQKLSEECPSQSTRHALQDYVLNWKLLEWVGIVRRDGAAFPGRDPVAQGTAVLVPQSMIRTS